ncbi:MAG TPA: M20 family metallopeptidase [Anaerolineales bacterium]
MTVHVPAGLDPQALLDQIHRSLPDMLADLELLVSHESPSTAKVALDRLARLLHERFDSLGAQASLLPDPVHGDHVQAVFPATGLDSLRPGLVLCHYDTVWPLGTLEQLPFRLEGGKAYGPGAFDMKASIVMVEFALRAIAALRLRLPRPLVVLLTSDEEIGSPGSRPWIEQHARQAEYALVVEPPSNKGALKTARKGVGRFILEIDGKAAHAGTQPGQGVSATHELAHQILNLQRLNNPERGTTVNVGVVRGGTRRNVVAARAEAEIDVRVWTLQEAGRFEQAIRDLKPVHPGAILRVRGGFSRPPMERTPLIAGLFSRAQQVGRQLGLDLKESATGGGSDANLTAALGLPTLDGLGAIGDGAHADHEHIQVDPLPVRTALLAALLLQL